jgi:hypothetical protein
MCSSPICDVVVELEARARFFVSSASGRAASSRTSSQVRPVPSIASTSAMTRFVLSRKSAFDARLFRSS